MALAGPPADVADGGSWAVSEAVTASDAAVAGSSGAKSGSAGAVET